MPIQIQTIKEKDEAHIVQTISGLIQSRLTQQHSVLWLVSGGSNISVAVEVKKQLDLSSGSLAVGLIDERHGPVGHNDSNWTQLLKAGFGASNCVMLPILDDTSASTAAANYSDKIESLLRSTDYAIGLLGLGSDGHTAGLLPNNSVTESDALYASYTAPDFERITATPKLLAVLDDRIVVAVGQQKQAGIKQVLEPGSIDDVPGRILQKWPTTLLTDYEG